MGPNIAYEERPDTKPHPRQNILFDQVQLGENYRVSKCQGWRAPDNDTLKSSGPGSNNGNGSD